MFTSPFLGVLVPTCNAHPLYKQNKSNKPSPNVYSQLPFLLFFLAQYSKEGFFTTEKSKRNAQGRNGRSNFMNIEKYDPWTYVCTYNAYLLSGFYFNRLFFQTSGFLLWASTGLSRVHKLFDLILSIPRKWAHLLLPFFSEWLKCLIEGPQILLLVWFPENLVSMLEPLTPIHLAYRITDFAVFHNKIYFTCLHKAGFLKRSWSKIFRMSNFVL